MTLESIYRDVNSRLSELDIDEKQITHNDTVKAINDSIKDLRVEYVKSGIGNEFAVTEIIDSFSEDSQYKFLNSATLSEEVLDDLPIELTVLSSTGYTTNDQIENTTQIFDKGDIARKGNDLYECMQTFSGVNTYTATFDQRNYRTFHQNNGRDYFEGDIVYVKADEEFYKVNTDFTNNTDTAPSSIAELDKLYWKRIGDADIYVSHYPFKNVQVLRTFESIGRVGGLSIKGNKVYVSDNVSELTITYVPKWTEVTDLNEDLNLPDAMVSGVKNRAIGILASKLNLEFQLAEKDSG